MLHFTTQIKGAVLPWPGVDPILSVIVNLIVRLGTGYSNTQQLSYLQ